MDCVGGKNPFLKLNCVFINNSPSVQVSSSHEVDGVNEDGDDKIEAVKEQKDVYQSHFCCISWLQRRKKQKRKQNGRKK